MSQSITTTTPPATSLPAFPVVPSFEQDDFLTDEEALEFEMCLSRDHDDASYWMGGSNV
jgi:hypothetical protein